MISRIRKSIDERDGGFTLIELLVVMIIIGILAAIAIPVFLSQRKKSQDSSAKADVSTIGKEIATYYVDGVGVPVITTSGGRYLMNVTAAAGPPVVTAISNQDLGKVGDTNVLGTTTITNATTWCVSVTNAKGDKAVTGYKYSATGGLGEGTC